MSRFAAITEEAIRASGKISGRAFRVFCAYALFADRNGDNAYPSKKTIAGMIGSDERGVQRAVHELVQAGMMQPAGFVRLGVARYSLTPGLLAAPPGQLTPGSMTTPPGQLATGPLAGTPGQVFNQPPAWVAETPGQPTTQPPLEHQRLREHMGSGEAPHVASLRDAGDQEAPSGRQDQDQEAAPPPAGKRRETDDQRAVRESLEREAAEDALVQAKRDRELAETIRDEASDLVALGVYSTLLLPARLPAAEALVRDYRARWPKSWPSTWTSFAAFPQAAIANPPAWVTAHVTGYAREGWIPENKPASERFIHLALLNGDPASALDQIGKEDAA